MLLARKFRLYPTPFQRIKLSRHFGANRWIYNKFINYNWNQYEKTGKSPSHINMCYELPKLKEEHPWLKDAPAQTLQNTLKNLGFAITRMIRKQGDNPNINPGKKRQSIGYIHNIVKSKEIKYSYQK